VGGVEHGLLEEGPGVGEEEARELERESGVDVQQLLDEERVALELLQRLRRDEENARQVVDEFLHEAIGHYNNISISS
jgi:hypothetical protein